MNRKEFIEELNRESDAWELAKGETNKGRNSMGCSESLYAAIYSIPSSLIGYEYGKNKYKRMLKWLEEHQEITDDEIDRWWKIANYIAGGLY